MTPQLAGIAAGEAWALSAHKPDVARLRSWCAWLFETDVWEYKCVYACILINKLVTDNTGKSGDNELLLAAEQAGYEALDFWRKFPGWPDDEGDQWSFIEGFVRGVACEEAQQTAPSMSNGDLTKLRAEHTAAIDAVYLARAKLERAQIDLAHYVKVADAIAERLKEATEAANR